MLNSGKLLKIMLMIITMFDIQNCKETQTQTSNSAVSNGAETYDVCPGCPSYLCHPGTTFPPCRCPACPYANAANNAEGAVSGVENYGTDIACQICNSRECFPGTPNRACRDCRSCPFVTTEGAAVGVENYGTDDACQDCKPSECYPDTINPACRDCRSCPFPLRATEGANVGFENYGTDISCKICNPRECYPGTQNPECGRCWSCPFGPRVGAAATQSEEVAKGVENYGTDIACKICNPRECFPGTPNPECGRCRSCPFVTAEGAAVGVETYGSDISCKICNPRECYPGTQNPECGRCWSCPFGPRVGEATQSEEVAKGVENWEVCPGCPVWDCVPGSWNRNCRCPQCQGRLGSSTGSESHATTAGAFVVGIGGLIGFSGGLFYYFKNKKTGNMYQTIEDDTL